MTTTTRAAVHRAVGEPLSIEPIVVADPEAGEVKVAVEACAICHSDIIFVDGGWDAPTPTIYGHEAAGRVLSVGPGITDVSVGDRVVVSLVRSCGACPSCLRGSHVTCSGSFNADRAGPIFVSADGDHAGEMIHQGLNTGTFAGQTVVDASQVVVIGGDVPFESAALLSCGVITGMGAVTNTAQVPPGSHVVVIGCGGVGLNSVQGAAIVGARTITALDLDDDKLVAADSFGATHTVRADAVDVADRVREIADGRGADFVFVTVGAKPAIEQALNLMAPGGTAVLVGMTPSGVSIELDPTTLASMSQRIIGSKMGSTRLRVDIPALVDLYRQGRLELDGLVSGRYALDDINDAIASVKRGEARRHVIVFDRADDGEPASGEREGAPA